MSLLYNEPPVAVSPTLMIIFGVPEAMFLQQVHYWIVNKKNNADKYEKSRVNGNWWVYNSLTEWQALLPYLGSESTIKRIISDLKSKGVLIVEKHNQIGFDKTNWYRINYLRLNQLIDKFNLTQRSGQIDPTIGSDLPDGQVQNDPIQSVNLTRPIPETTQRLQTKTTTNIDSIAHDAESVDDFELDSEPTTADEFNALSISNVSDFQKVDLPAGDCGKVEKRKPPRGGHDPEGFAKFWAQYPRKTAKDKAQHAWNRLKPDVGLQDTILRDLAQRKQNDHQWRDVAFVPHAATYLNGARWQDEIIKPNTQSAGVRQAKQENNDGVEELWAIMRGEIA